MSIFKRAERKQAKLRLAFIGVSGSGKTYSALKLAKGLGGKIAFLDTERGSASLYSDICDFDTCELNAPFSPERYVKVIKEAEKAGYNTLIIDSLSHAWAGAGGLLEMVDNYTSASKSGNAFSTGWKKCTPEQNKLVDAILMSDMHVICCIRTKTAYELQANEKGKLTPVKIGLAPIQREGIDYEFTLIFDIDHDSHLALASKNRTSLFKSAPFLITEDTGKEIAGWLNEGDAIDNEKIDSIKQDYIDKARLAASEEELTYIYKQAVSEIDDTNFKATLIAVCKERKEVLLADHKEFIAELDADQRPNMASPENYSDIRG